MRLLSSPTSSLAILAVLASQANAFWRLPCNQPLVVERVDPIVSAGAVSGHVHTISGASNFSPTSTFDDLRKSDCTSCLVTQDKSVYWTPALYFQWKNGSFTKVDQSGGGLIYYLPRAHSSDKTEVLAFPDGLRMLAGSMTLRSYNASNLMAQAIGWDCLGGPGRNPYLPTTTCPNGLRGEIRFPSCWDGVNTDSADHQSHVVYSDGESGPCPVGFQNRIVTLFYEMMWNIAPFDNFWNQAMNPKSPFVISTGDAVGTGYHGDFFDGWDKTVLQNAIRTCTDDSGVIEDCPVFNLQPDATCAKTPDVDEIVTGTLPSLPGCNPVTTGPANAVPCKAATVPSFFNNPVAYTGKVPPPGAEVLPGQPSVLQNFNSWVYQDCYSDNVANRALPNSLKTVNQTVEACLDACDAGKYSLCGVEYHGQCWGGNKLQGGSTAVGFGQCDLTCTDNPLQYCGGGNPTAMELYARGVAPSHSTTIATSTKATTSITSSTGVASSTGVKVTTSSSSSSTSTTSSVVTTSTKFTTTTTSSTVTVTMPVTSQLPGKLYTSAAWAYSGCFSDLVPGRTLPNQLSSNSTIEGCLAAADAAGYAVAGLEYSGECWAASALSPASSALADSHCRMACKNAPLETCGGAAALDLYISKKTTPIKPVLSGNLATVGAYSYKGCFSDLVVGGQRVLSKTLTGSSNQTIEGCIAACAKLNLPFCGVEYYGECYGGTSLSSASSALDASRCTYSCKNNPLENCGGAAALSVYTTSAAKQKRQNAFAIHSRRHKSRHGGF